MNWPQRRISIKNVDKWLSWLHFLTGGIIPTDVPDNIQRGDQKSDTQGNGINGGDDSDRELTFFPSPPVKDRAKVRWENETATDGDRMGDNLESFPDGIGSVTPPHGFFDVSESEEDMEDDHTLVADGNVIRRSKIPVLAHEHSTSPAEGVDNVRLRRELQRLSEFNKPGLAQSTDVLPKKRKSKWRH